MYASLASIRKQSIIMVDVCLEGRSSGMVKS